MEIRIKETGKIEELVIIDPKTGLDWAADLTGNDDNITSDGDCRICDQETFDWWADLIKRYQEADDRLHEMLDDTDDRDALLEHVQSCSGCDIENYPEFLMDVLDEWESKTDITQNCNTCQNWIDATA